MTMVLFTLDRHAQGHHARLQLGEVQVRSNVPGLKATLFHVGLVLDA